LEILLNEVALDDIRIQPRTPSAPLPQVFHIQPDRDLHDITTIDPGLIQIARDYGYMRAADVIGGVDRRSRRWIVPTEIALLRKEIWALENRRFGHSDPTRRADPTPAEAPGLQPIIDQQKLQLRALMNERRSLNGPMPWNIDQWSWSLERHPWHPPFPPASAVVNGYAWEGGQSKQIVYTTGDGHIHELYVNVGGVWKDSDLTA
jgi:NTE family protein